MIVVDTSVVMSWLFEDEGTFGARLMEVQRTANVAPAVCAYEVCNALQMAVRHERMQAEDATAALRLFYEMRVEIEAPPSRHVAERILSLCGSYGVTAYDAAYLELASRLNAALATYDQRLGAAATKAGIVVV